MWIKIKIPFSHPVFSPAQLYSFLCLLPGNQGEREDGGQSKTAPHSLHLSLLQHRKAPWAYSPSGEPTPASGAWVAMWPSAPRWSLPKLPGAVKEALIQGLRHLLPSSFSHLGVCSVFPHTFPPLTPHCLCGALCFLKHYRRSVTNSAEGQLCPAGGQLEPARTDCVRHEAAPASPHRNCLCSTPPLHKPWHLHHIHSIYDTKQHQLLMTQQSLTNQF